MVRRNPGSNGNEKGAKIPKIRGRIVKSTYS